MKLSFLTLICLLFSILTAFGQTSFTDAQKAALEYIADEGLSKNTKNNYYVDKNNVIHVFMYEDGNFLLSAYPTTATEENKYQVHLYVKAPTSTIYRLEVVGTYEPVLNIDEQSSLAPTTQALERIDYAVLGPYTNSVTFTLKSSTGGADYKVVNSTTVKVAKTIHASIGTGFVYSTLKNPTGIKAVPLANGDSTLLADNPKGNATLTLMATLYPWGRNNLMMTSRSWKDRMGIVVGTTIASSEKNFKNLYLGAQYDFAVGGSIVLGADIAERQRIMGIDYSSFEFGKDKFTGNLQNRLYKSVGVGFFLGVQVDSRIFSKMFSN